MFSKVLLVSLFVAVAVAAPAPSIPNRRPTPDVPCTSVVSPEGANAAPSSSVIILNSPSDVGRVAGPQGPANPPVINLNPPAPSPSIINLNAPAPSPSIINLNAPAPAPSPSVINLNARGVPPSAIKLNRRQLSSLPATSTFSFGGIVSSNTISSTPLSSSGTPAASSLPSFSFGGIVASSSAPVSTATPSPGASNGTSTFSSTGPDGVHTVLLLSTVTVSGAACTSAPALNPSQALGSPPASSVIAPSSAVGANIQASSPSIINLNSPSATITSAPGFSFSSAPAANVTPAV